MQKAYKNILLALSLVLTFKPHEIRTDIKLDLSSAVISTTLGALQPYIEKIILNGAPDNQPSYFKRICLGILTLTLSHDLLLYYRLVTNNYSELHIYPLPFFLCSYLHTQGYWYPNIDKLQTNSAL